MHALLLLTAGDHSNFSALIAYLDPGSGSIILQMIIAAAAGFVYTLRVQIANFLKKIRGNTKENKSDENREGESN